MKGSGMRGEREGIMGVESCVIDTIRKLVSEGVFACFLF